MNELEFAMKATVSELGAARDRCRLWLGEMGEPVGDWPLVLSELLMNAIETSSGPIAVRLSATDDAIVLEVTDQGPGFAFEIEAPSATQQRGRGLWIVNEVVDSLQVHRTNAGNVVRCSRTRQTDDGAPGSEHSVVGDRVVGDRVVSDRRPLGGDRHPSDRHRSNGNNGQHSSCR